MVRRTRAIKDILWFFALAGLVGAILRLWFGLGATTNLSDATPWGLWKILNMVGGVALSTSGFTVGFLVYVLGLKKFQSFMKPAILVAFLGYGCSCLALLFDIGLPHRFWHPIFMWNINSFLFEVFWCVLLYFTVTAIELAPVIFERFRSDKIVHILHKVGFVVVLIGITLSSLHHSSLGSLFLVTPQRLYPLWYTPWLPILFIVSAMGGGLMVVVLIKLLWAWAYDRASIFGSETERKTPLIQLVNGKALAVAHRPQGPEFPKIRAMATIAASILGFYLLLKIVDLFVHGGWHSLSTGNWESWLYMAELVLGVALPILLVSIPNSRHSAAGIGFAAFFGAFGLALNRLDVGIFGYFRDSGVIYFPSLIEWAVGIGVIAAAGLVLLFLSEHLPIFNERPPASHPGFGLLKLSFGSLRQLWNTALTDGLHRVTLLSVFVLPLAFVLMYPNFYDSSRDNRPVRPASGINADRTILLIDGNNNGVKTIFPHTEHQKRLGDSTSCGKCHHVSFPNDRSTPCFRCHRRINTLTNIFNHESHIMAVVQTDSLTGIHPANHSCLKCHEEQNPKTAGKAKDCMSCHKEDMFLAGNQSDTLNLRLATSYREAMHGTCIECHKKEAVKQGKPHLGDCQTCHESLRAKTI
jgi:Ni/Fe-hydrogenase subunit HybB-like protein